MPVLSGERVDAERRTRFAHARRGPVERVRIPALTLCLAVVVAVLTAVQLAPTGVVRRPEHRPSPAPARQPDQPRAPTGPAPTPQSGPAGAAPTDQPISFPPGGSGTWRTAPGQDRGAGGAGELLRYRVAVERGIRNVDPVDFAEQVSATLADPRGWTGESTRRLRRVGPDAPADFTIYLATPITRDKLCGAEYDRYTSCRNGDRVVINVDRWANGAPPFAGDLATYRHYVVNHEVGHRLGHGHQRCPGPGRPAPVMQQQTLGLHGCRPNAWPYLNGGVYSGPAGEYDDPVPAAR